MKPIGIWRCPMTTRTAILLLAIILIAGLLLGCDDVAEWITGDQAANRAHGRQAGAETTWDVNLEAPTMEVPR